jgi:4-phytase/acid phosphatase
MAMTRWLLSALLLAGSAVAASAAGGNPADMPPAGLSIDRVVILMRHGVRPPTKAQPMPVGIATDPWPSWPVKAGWLTPNGTRAVGRIGTWDAMRLRKLGVLPAQGCPAKGTVRVVADSDQRTIATADAWLTAVAADCGIVNEHKPQDEPDPVFNAIEEKLAPFDPAIADKAVAAVVGPNGIGALEKASRPLLARLDKILCGKAVGTCGVGHEPTIVEPAAVGQRPGLGGALDRASTAAQILLLEYADGKSMNDVGWGRATAADVSAFSVFHALEFRILARPAYIARANLAGILPIVRSGLDGPARVTIISGHDTNIANMGGLLGIHWQVPGLAADDPSPGGAIVIERLSDKKGKAYVRALYRSQTLSQIRSGAALAPDAPYRAVLPIPGCTALAIQGLCTLADFQAKIGTAIH